MQYMKFYKLYDWILNEFGASGDAALVSIIYSFEENGVECKLSYSQFAEILKITRPRAIERIQRLIAMGYISVITNSTKTNTYSVNLHSFGDGELTSSENRTSKEKEPEQLVPKTELALVPKTELPSAENGTSTSSENRTQIENRKENRKDNGMREGARANSTSAFFPIPDHAAIKLTEDQYTRLQSEVTGTGRSLESYFRNLEAAMKSKHKSYEPHSDTLLAWIQSDKDKAGSQVGSDQIRSQDTGSSIDMSIVEQIMDPYGLQRKKSSINEEAYQQIMNPYGDI